MSTSNPAQMPKNITLTQRLKKYLPIMNWLPNYSRADVTGDLIAGIIVTVMLVPQGMAYALLAELPAQVGLYASIIPLFIYGLLGTSRTLAVGPVAIVSLMVASGIGQFAPQSLSETLLLAVTLAAMVGSIQLILGILRAGFIVNFLSHPVLSGFTSAAAIVIGLSQLKNLMGFDVPRSQQLHETAWYVFTNMSLMNVASFAIGVGGILILLYFKFGLGKHLAYLSLPKNVIVPLTKTGPLVIVVIGTLLVWGMGLNTSADVSIVGTVPAGLPPFTMPTLELETLQALFPIALTISLVGYMEGISVAKALASKRREKVDPNQELIAIGTSNIASALTGGYPIAGGFGRSMVNFTSGARTGLASVITAVLLLFSVLFLTPLFTYLPNAILAAIIIVAVANLIDVKTAIHTWHYSKAEFLSLAITFVAVLELGIETGILIGVATSLILYLYRTSRPHVAVIGRIGTSEEYRNVLRYETTMQPNILALRIDESLYFPNATYLEQVVGNAVADNPELEHFVLVCSAVNFIDTSALEVLENLNDTLTENGISFNMAGVKGPVMDRLRKIGFDTHIGQENFYLNCHEACESLATE
ncbi:MAG: sulfate permease [Chloroflexota bacterium]